MAPVIVALITFAVAFVAGAILSKAYFNVQQSRPESPKIRSSSDDPRHAMDRLRTELRVHAKEVATDRADTDAAAGLRAELGQMRESLARRDRQVRELELKLKESRGRILDLTARLDSWRERVKPLTTKLKQQQDLIRMLRKADTERDGDRHAGEDDATRSTDNLKRIRGIGPALERRLHRHGIRRYDQIAELSNEDLLALAKQIAIAPNLAQRDGWVQQARELVDERAAPV